MYSPLLMMNSQKRAKISPDGRGWPLHSLLPLSLALPPILVAIGSYYGHLTITFSHYHHHHDHLFLC